MKKTEDFKKGILFGINNCNAEFQVILLRAYEKFEKLKRINKRDVVLIFDEMSCESLGEEVNPFMEDAEPTRTAKTID